MGGSKRSLRSFGRVESEGKVKSEGRIEMKGSFVREEAREVKEGGGKVKREIEERLMNPRFSRKEVGEIIVVSPVRPKR